MRRCDQYGHMVIAAALHDNGGAREAGVRARNLTPNPFPKKEGGPEKASPLGRDVSPTSFSLKKEGEPENSVRPGRDVLPPSLLGKQDIEPESKSSLGKDLSPFLLREGGQGGLGWPTPATSASLREISV